MHSILTLLLDLFVPIYAPKENCGNGHDFRPANNLFMKRSYDTLVPRWVHHQLNAKLCKATHPVCLLIHPLLLLCKLIACPEITWWISVLTNYSNWVLLWLSVRLTDGIREEDEFVVYWWVGGGCVNWGQEAHTLMDFDWDCVDLIPRRGHLSMNWASFTPHFGGDRKWRNLAAMVNGELDLKE